MRRLWLVMLLPLILIACGGDDTPPPPTETPTVTPVTPTLLPPTWTPAPEGFRPTWTPSPTSDTAAAGDAFGGPGGSGDYPPTWTPVSTQGVSENVGSGNTGGEGAGSFNEPPTKTPPAPTWTPQPDWCYEIQSISEDFRIRAGESVTIEWQPVPNVASFRIEIRHPGGMVVFGDITVETQFEVPGSYFNQAVAYGWQVQPLDADGEPVCFPISGEVVVSFD